MDALAYTSERALCWRAQSTPSFVCRRPHLIFDADLECIPEPAGLADALVRIPGVVEHGLFLNLASKAYVAGEDGVKTITPASE